MDNGILVTGSLDEDAGNQARITRNNFRTEDGVIGDSARKKMGGYKRDPRNWNFILQFTNMGAGTADIDVLGPGDAWSSWSTGHTNNESVIIDQGRWRSIRATFTATGGSAVMNYQATPKAF